MTHLTELLSCKGLPLAPSTCTIHYFWGTLRYEKQNCLSFQEETFFENVRSHSVYIVVTNYSSNKIILQVSVKLFSALYE
jgi:hypothetical protein